MITIKINNIPIQTPEGTYLHLAAQQAGIEIPVMCWYEGMEHFTSCMVCMVKDRETGKFIPSCSVKVHEGMDIVTDDPEVTEARKIALELLLSEHVGDCEAPCKITCPAGMDIPLMNRLLAKGEFDEALEIVRNDIALPSVLGRICPAPCEGACRRKPMDGAVAICLLKRFAGDNKPDYKPVIAAKKNGKIAIIGAGPAGLAASYYLAIRGFHCDIFESEAKAGGAIRVNVSTETLPVPVLDKEIGIIEKMGVAFHFNRTVDKTIYNELLASHDAVIIACSLVEKEIKDFGLEFSGNGIKAGKASYQTNNPKVFAIGSALRPSKMAIRSLGQGKEVAFSVEQLLSNEPVTGEKTLFNSRFGRLLPEEFNEYLKESLPGDRLEPSNGISKGFSTEEVMKEAARCLNCDCRGKNTCLLRTYAHEMKADQKSFASEERKHVKKFNQHDYVIYEPSKCIKCSRCVRITELYREKFGFTFIGRGFSVEIGVPFDESINDAFTSTANEVIKACPTGALERNLNAT